jgi:hypothetical protein
MRFLKAIIVFLAFAVITPAFGQTCCPSGCVQDANRCVKQSNNQITCAPVLCSPSGAGNSGSGSGGGGGTGPSGSFPGGRDPTPLCQTVTATQADVDAKTKQCLDRLTGNAILFGCLFENAHNQAEDQRTGLTCGQRQTILAQQCRNRCTKWANYAATHWCWYNDNNNSDWQMFFKDIGGTAVGAADVERCGPRLKSARDKPQPRRTP